MPISQFWYCFQQGKPKSKPNSYDASDLTDTQMLLPDSSRIEYPMEVHALDWPPDISNPMYSSAFHQQTSPYIAMEDIPPLQVSPSLKSRRAKSFSGFSDQRKCHKFFCNSCQVSGGPQGFTKHSDLMRHLKSVHTQKGNHYLCGCCKNQDSSQIYSSSRKDHIKQHLRKFHKMTEPEPSHIECPVEGCEGHYILVFGFESCLLTHLDRCHEDSSDVSAVKGGLLCF